MKPGKKNVERVTVPAQPSNKEGLPASLPLHLPDHISDSIIIIGSRHEIITCNKAACQLFDISREEVTGKIFSIAFPLDYQDTSFEEIAATLVEDHTWEGRFAFTTKQGKTLHLSLTFLPRESSGQEGHGLIIIGRPLLEPTVPDAGTAGPVAIELIANALAEGLIVRNHQGEIILFNTAASRILAMTEQEIKDKAYVKSHYRFIYEDGRVLPYEDLPSISILQTMGSTNGLIMGVYKPDGSLSWLNVNSYPILDEISGKAKATVTSFSNITDIKMAREEVKRSEEQWRSVLDNSKSGVFLIDQDYHLMLVNEYGKKILKLLFNVSEIGANNSLVQMLPEARKQPVKEIIKKAIAGQRVEYEIVYTKEDNEEIWLLVNYAPVMNPGGQISSICITASDITKLKRNENDLLKSEKRWKFALDGAGDGVWEYNFQTKESYYSPLYKTMLGFAEDEFLNEAFEWQTRLHPDDLYKIANIDAAYENGTIENHSIEYRLKNKAGEYIWVLDRGMLLERSAGGKPVKLVGTHKNITERKLAEKKLLQSQQLFSSFMDNTPTMTWIIDENAVFRYLNTSYLKSFGLMEDAIGKSIYDIFPKHICDAFVENNWKVWNTGHSIETLEEGIGPDGMRQMYHIFKFPLDQEDGTRLLGGVALDITQKTQLEKKLTEEEEKKKREIIQAIINAQEDERHELASELHDNVNQILSSSKLMLEVAIEKPELGKEFATKGLGYLHDAINEIRRISHNLIPATLRDISLEAAIEEVIQNINASGKLKVFYSRNILAQGEEVHPEIQLSVLRIVQEQFNNILKHAEATETSLSLFIDKNTIFLTMQDNGQGFDTARTKKGIGLNSIFNRAEYYHGKASLSSVNGEGCLLHIEIPVKARL